MFVVEDAGAVIASAYLRPNYGGPAGRVANAGFMVDPAAVGRGVGRALAEHVLREARDDGYTAMVGVLTPGGFPDPTRPDPTRPDPVRRDRVLVSGAPVRPRSGPVAFTGWGGRRTVRHRRPGPASCAGRTPTA